MNFLNKDNDKTGDVIKVLKVSTNSDAEILTANLHNNVITVDFSSETYSVPKTCKHFFWTVKGTLKSKIFKCYLLVHGIPHAVDLDDLIKLSDNYNKIVQTKFRPEDLNSMMKSKIISDFLNVSSSLKWWLILLLLGGGITIGVCITFLLIIGGVV